jgi:hypothetical protein
MTTNLTRAFSELRRLGYILQGKITSAAKHARGAQSRKN